MPKSSEGYQMDNGNDLVRATEEIRSAASKIDLFVGQQLSQVQTLQKLETKIEHFEESQRRVEGNISDLSHLLRGNGTPGIIERLTQLEAGLKSIIKERDLAMGYKVAIWAAFIGGVCGMIGAGVQLMH